MAIIDQQNTGMRNMLIPGARIRSTVHSTVPDISIIPMVARKVPRIHSAMPAPGVYCPVDSGVYANQPSEAAPCSVRKPERTLMAPNR